MEEHQHKWIVYSTALDPPTIMVKCKDCEVEGLVRQFSKDEWQTAFSAPSKPYPWTDPLRVLIGERRLKSGTQIVYIPLHAKGDEGHSDVEEGFVTSHLYLDSVFCRYWSKHDPDELRTKANSEGTPLWCIREKVTRPQELVDAMLEKIERE